MLIRKGVAFFSYAFRDDDVISIFQMTLSQFLSFTRNIIGEHFLSKFFLHEVHILFSELSQNAPAHLNGILLGPATRSIGHSRSQNRSLRSTKYSLHTSVPRRV